MDCAVVSTRMTCHSPGGKASRTSCTNRDLPIPASPTRATAWLLPPAARRSAALTWASSVERLTNGDRVRVLLRTVHEGWSRAPTRRWTSSGPARPLSMTSPTGSVWAMPMTRCSVCGAIRMVPGSARCSSRAAMWAVTPATS